MDRTNGGRQGRLRLSVRAKLLGTSLALIALTGAVGLVGALSLNSASAKSADIVSRGTSTVHTLDQLQAAVKALPIAGQGIGLSSDPAMIKQYSDETAAFQKAIADGLAAFAKSNPTPEEQQLLGQIQANFQKLNALTNTSVKGKLDDATTAQVNTVNAAVAADVDKLVAARLALATSLNTQIDSTVQLGLLGIVVAFAISVVLGLGRSLLTSRRIARGVADVRGTLSSVAEHCATDLATGLGASAQNDLTVRIVPVTQPIDLQRRRDRRHGPSHAQ